MKELVIHYEEKIQELKRHNEIEDRLSQDKISKLNQTLREKQQEVLELL